MIRIRYSAPASAPPDIWENPFIALTTDPHVLVSESEKNSPATANAVDRILRPVIDEQWQASARLFSIVSIETRAGCNYSCNFCPVARAVDPRPPGVMTDDVVSSVAAQLADLGYTGHVSLFGNNEPLLDDRLPGIIELFRDAAPDACLRVLTNGTLLSRACVEDLFARGLTTLVVNNYTDGHKLIKPVRLLLDEAAAFAAVDIRVNMRRRDEILTTRGGTAPNKMAAHASGYGFCALPFTDLHISYTGDVSVCCFDAHGVTTMGNVAEASLLDVWYGSKMQAYRDRLLESTRDGLVPCEDCDFDGFRDPAISSGHILVRSDVVREAQSEL